MNTIQLIITGSSIGAIFNNVTVTNKNLSVSTYFNESIGAAESSSNSLTYDNIIFNVTVNKAKDSFKTNFSAKYTVNKENGESCVLNATIEKNVNLNYDLVVDAYYANKLTGVYKSDRFTEANALQADVSQREILVDFESLITSSIPGLFVVS